MPGTLPGTGGSTRAALKLKLKLGRSVRNQRQAGGALLLRGLVLGVVAGDPACGRIPTPSMHPQRLNTKTHNPHDRTALGCVRGLFVLPVHVTGTSPSGWLSTPSAPPPSPFDSWIGGTQGVSQRRHVGLHWCGAVSLSAHGQCQCRSAGAAAASAHHAVRPCIIVTPSTA